MLAFTGTPVPPAPIVVEAQKEESRTFSSHYSFEKIDPKALYQNNHLDDLNILGLTRAGGTSRSRYFQIRGIGERSAYEGMPNSSVSVVIDEIDYTGYAGILSLNGLESLEVHKGPQNTLIGPSALAGMIRATTKKAEDNSALLQGERSSFNGLNFYSEKSLKNENSSAFMAAQYQKNDGYFNNSFLKKQDTNDIDELSLRLRLDGGPWRLSLHHFNFDNGYDVFNLENGKTTRSDKPGKDTQRTTGSSLRHRSRGRNFQLDSIISAHFTDTEYSYDEDWGNNPFWNALPSYNANYDYNIRFTHEVVSATLEERLTLEQGRFSHRSGLFIKSFSDKQREHAFKNEQQRKDLQSHLKRRTYSLYHESEYALKDKLTIFVGARLEHVNSSYQDNQQISFRPNDTMWGGRIGLKKRGPFYESSLSLSRGFKAGGVNIGSQITSDRRNFEDESQIVLSWKNRLIFDRLEVKTDLFYALREDIQVKTSYQDNPTDPSSFTFYTDNGTSGKSLGLELNSLLSVTEWWKTTLSASALHTRYGSYIYGSRNLKGRNFPYAPEYFLDLKNTFQITSSLDFSAQHIYRDNFYFGNSHDEQAPKSLVTNLALNYQLRNWTFNLWGRNIFNERTETRGFFFGNRPPNFNNERFVQVGAPATYGLKVSYSF